MDPFGVTWATLLPPQLRPSSRLPTPTHLSVSPGPTPESPAPKTPDAGSTTNSNNSPMPKDSVPLAPQPIPQSPMPPQAAFSAPPETNIDGQIQTLKSGDFPLKHRAVVSIIIKLTSGFRGVKIRVADLISSLQLEYRGAKPEFLFSLMQGAENDCFLSRETDRAGIEWVSLQSPHPAGQEKPSATSKPAQKQPKAAPPKPVQEQPPTNTPKQAQQQPIGAPKPAQPVQTPPIVTQAQSARVRTIQADAPSTDIQTTG